MRWLLLWLINAAVLLLLSYLLPGVEVDGFLAALAMALVLGLVNAVLRPLLVLLTLPITLLTLGLFVLVINGLLFALAAYLVPGFHVSGLLTGIAGALLYSLFSWAASAVAGIRRD